MSSLSNVSGNEPVHAAFPLGSDEVGWGASVHEDSPNGLGPASREFLAVPRRTNPTGGAVLDDPIQMGILVTDTPQEAFGVLATKPTDPPSGGGQVMYASAGASDDAGYRALAERIANGTQPGMPDADGVSSDTRMQLRETLHLGGC